ncbi:DUF2062 domain-containing protein [Candidatus Methylospira mobilis]|uniref:DUF2062 domain-containing protein n=1 Tax=Candidatus Methylospira mobilis TaxID=1808979 RepID=A0A5Q0BMT4_9GAMM|nr:DUF2062 domain-containing protein [Candidatus Methylospira mobilis]QFY43428.1 DUF2062 domain-containing protein [Candidatus Methylospira mobilis]WNV03333.1 DUF2062 domain-containing protein [Candidatus Methylospira mobilis]
MPKGYFTRFIPTRHNISEIKGLAFLGEKLHRPNLWHVNRRSVSRAFAVGLWAMYTPPLPWQSVIAAIGAIAFNANLPISVALVWITNPVTWIPMYYFAYRVGAFSLGQSAFNFNEFSGNFSIEKALELGAPFLLGCFILMNLGALLGYVGTRLLWRQSVLERWEARKLRNKPFDPVFFVNQSHASYQRYLKHERKRQ